jgi:branched-chain amino acid transport system permease protein
MTRTSTELPRLDREQEGTAWKALAKSAVAPVLGLAFAFVMLALQRNALPPYYARILLDVGIAMMLAVSLNIVNGMTGQFSIGHAGFMALGGYTAGMVTYYGSLALWGSASKTPGLFSAGEWLLPLGCLAGALVAAIAGYIVGLPSLRLRGDYLAIVTLGFGEIMRVLLQQTNKKLEPSEFASATWGDFFPPPVGAALGFNGLPTYTNLFWVYLFLSLTVIIAYRLKQSGIGRSMIAIREDEIAAHAMGVNVTRVKVRSFIIAAALAGAAGGLYAHELGVTLAPTDAGFAKSFDLIIMTVLGGNGSISGVMVAAVLVTILPELLRTIGAPLAGVLQSFSDQLPGFLQRVIAIPIDILNNFENYRLIVYALLLISMMLIRPQGLFGSREVWDWFMKRRPARKAVA